MPELPMIRRDPECPAASKIGGACGSQQGVVCRAMQRDVERDDGTELGMSAGEYGFLQHEATGGIYLNLKSDPASVVSFCYGRGIPVLTDDDHLARDHYSYCPVWQAEKRRIAAGRDELAPERHPEPVSMGLEPAASHLSADPWAAARLGLDELAPVQG